MKAKKVRLFIMAAVMAASLAGTSVIPALATSPGVETGSDHSEDQSGETNPGDIDENRKGTLKIYKYDITAAEAAGDYEAGQEAATGKSDQKVEDALRDYAIEGVQFSYMRVGDVQTYHRMDGEKSYVELVYEIPSALAKILNLPEEDAVDPFSSEKDGEDSSEDKDKQLYYTSQQISAAIAAIQAADDVAAKNALENYFYDYGTISDLDDERAADGVVNMKLTNAQGYTVAENLEQGLYLIVETEVPENVTSTVNPWFVQVPFTGAGNAGDDNLLYDITCYPKNQTGNPTLDKSVRNAYNNSNINDKNKTIDVGNDYVVSGDTPALVVYDKDKDRQINEKDTSDEAYVVNRGGYTSDGLNAAEDSALYSYDFTYRDTNTASQGDLMDYILVSRIPRITSRATYLSEYTFEDALSKGLTYNNDVKIAFYKDADNAKVNNTDKAVKIWDLNDDSETAIFADVSYSDDEPAIVKSVKLKSESESKRKMTVRMTEKGLEEINSKYSEYYMVVYYTATMNSDASVVLGDDGNENDVTLVWSRSTDEHSSTLEDKNYVYSYGIDLTKTFSDKKGDFSKVNFKLYNSTDGYYVVAEAGEDGVYYVTGKTTDEKAATVFTPAVQGGNLLVNGIEADQYQLTETATDTGYSLLKDPIVIDITSADVDLVASVAGVTGMDKDAVNNIVKNYNGGLINENGNLVTAGKDELTGGNLDGPDLEDANGHAISKTGMRAGTFQASSAKVNNQEAKMTATHAAVMIAVENTKSFLLPQTGGSGLYGMTIIGVVVAAGGIYLVTRKKKTV